ncbi:MAG TPA: hypothetical protein VHK01_20685 [Lacipirellulaceae bacterium]|nr:hypothetical protein [Lacipirellulaceae bacterium]
MRTNCSSLVRFLLFVAIGSTCSSAGAQIWRNFLPTAKDEEPANLRIRDENVRPASDTQPAGDREFSLTQENGPWLIVAASFSGQGAERQATELARELRSRYRLKAYLHEMNFRLDNENLGRGLDEYGGSVRLRYQRGDQLRELAVLVGDFASIDDPEAQQTLERIKTLQPDALNVDPNTSAQSMVQVRQGEGSLLEKLGRRKRGPMAQAFLTRNPRLPREYFVPKGVDPFVAKMNQGVEHSLLDCPGNYTVKVATFRGKTILQTSATSGDAAEGRKTPFWSRRKKDDHNPLIEAAENAHLLTAELRAHGYEAYEFHDRNESMVTIGSFAQSGQQLPDGRVVPTPAVQRIIETFGAAYDTPPDPLSGIGNDAGTQRRVKQQEQQFNMRVDGQQSPVVPGMNPKHVKIFSGNGKRKKVDRIIPMDVYPQAIEVPKRSVSSAYAS